MKKALALILALVLVFALAACSDSGSGSSGSDKPADSSASKDPVTVTFWNNWSGPDGELLRSLVDEYNQNNTENITIDMDIMQFEMLNEKMATAIASNTCPNMNLGFAVGEYSMSGSYLPIDDIWEKTSLKKEDFVQDILNSCYYEGKLMGIPFQVTSMFVYWNKELFRQAGLDPDKGIETWEDMITASKAIDALGGNVIGGGLDIDDTSFSQSFGSVILAYGGNVVVDDNNDGNYRPALTDPKYIDGNRGALDFIKRFADETKILQGGNMEEGYGSGVVGIIVGGAWETANAKDNSIDYGLSLLPKGPAGGPCQPGSPACMCVMKGTTGRTYDACLHFIAYWNDTRSTTREKCPAYDWSMKQAYQPYLVDVANDPTLTSDPTFQITNEYSKYVANYYPVSFWNTFALGSGYISPMVENVVYNRKTIDEAIETAQRDIQAMCDDMYETERNLGIRE